MRRLQQTGGRPADGSTTIAYHEIVLGVPVRVSLSDERCPNRAARQCSAFVGCSWTDTRQWRRIDDVEKTVKKQIARRRRRLLRWTNDRGGHWDTFRTRLRRATCRWQRRRRWRRRRREADVSSRPQCYHTADRYVRFRRGSLSSSTVSERWYLQLRSNDSYVRWVRRLTNVRVVI